MSLLRRIERGGQGGSGDEPPDQSKLNQMRKRTQVPQSPSAASGSGVRRRVPKPAAYQDLKVRVQNKLLAELDTGVDPHSPGSTHDD